MNDDQVLVLRCALDACVTELAGLDLSGKPEAIDVLNHGIAIVQEFDEE